MSISYGGFARQGRGTPSHRGVVTVRGIASTGCEMEALAGATIGALNAYDMLKPHSESLELAGARLLGKRGGTSDWRERLGPPVRAAVIVLSDSVAAGSKADKAGISVRERLVATGCVDVEVYARHCRRMAQGLRELGFHLPPVRAGFFLFPRLPDALRALATEAESSDVVLTERLRAERCVVVPGTAFGVPDHLRLSMCVDDVAIDGALQAFRAVCG